MKQIPPTRIPPTRDFSLNLSYWLSVIVNETLNFDEYVGVALHLLRVVEEEQEETNDE